MKKFRGIYLSVFLFLGSALFAVPTNISPVAPSEPSVDDVKIPDVQSPGLTTNGLEPLFIMRATAVFSDGMTWKGVVHLTNNSVVTVSNMTAKGLEIRTLSIYNIDSIRVTRWTAEKKNGDLYQFTPSEYRIVAVGTDTNGLAYTGNIPVLNQFVFSDDRAKKALYTFFFDRWIEGKKGFFRWENSRSTSFPYNFTNPLPGVVVEIDFDRNF